MLAFIFIVAGTVVPKINSEFGGTDAQEYVVNDGSLPTDEDGDVEYTQIDNTFWSIVSMFFWTFGSLPWWLDAFFVMLRIVFWGIVIELLWIG